jgi:ABC-type transport system substrate-binding protein
MLIKKKINQNLVSVVFFVSIYLLGLSVFKDYGIYIDDEYQRNNAFFWYNYIKNIAINLGTSPTTILESLINNDIQIINSSTIPSLQPTALGIFCEFFIDIFKYQDTKDIYQSRHLYNFTIFFIGLYFFKKLIYFRFKSAFIFIFRSFFLINFTKIFCRKFL